MRVAGNQTDLYNGGQPCISDAGCPVKCTVNALTPQPMLAKRVYCDEAGNTGAALLDKAQPVFVLSSLDYFDQEAEELLGCVESSQGGEAKFTSLKKSERGKNKLIEFFAQPGLTPHRVKTTVFHKQYMAITKAVDIIVETLAHDDGIDLYERGGNIALANLHFYATPVYCGRDRFDQFMESFVAMIRKKDKASIEQFFYWAWQLYSLCTNKEYQSMLAPFLVAESSIDDILKNIDYLSLDPAIPSFFNHCVAWGEQYGADFDVLHDDSKPLYAAQDTLRMFMDRTIPPTKIGYDRRRFVFPLKAKTLNFGDSRVCRQLQMADLVAGACAYLCSCRANGSMNDFAQALETEAQLDRFVINALWPSKDVTPAALETEQEGGINAADYIADVLSTKRI